MEAGSTGDAFRALVEGRWADARAGFEMSLEVAESPDACFGLAMALWWLGENHAAVEWCRRAYAVFAKAGDVESAARCAVWLAITYKANFANFASANGWISRAGRLLAARQPGALHGWVLVARGYRMTDLKVAEDLTDQALVVARACGDADLELVALSQLGLVRVGQGELEAGFGLLDEAMAAALAGERSTLDTVVYTCCDMLSACEIASDIERASQWCQVADVFVARYGCPFLYAECRIYYGSVLTATGRWTDAERELATGLRITQGTCPGLYGRAVTRLAGLRVRQGRVEDAEQLLAGIDGGVEAEATLLTAAVSLARGDAGAAARLLEQRLRHVEEHRWHLAGALELLVEAYLADGDVAAASEAADRLTVTADAARSLGLNALATFARGRVLLARGERRGIVDLETALQVWSAMSLPLEAGRARLEIARALATSEHDAAIDHARRALGTFETLGASTEADRAAGLLRSLGVVPRTGLKRAGVLTVREQEVLRLVEAGLSNPEIAERLHISRKTASHHVSSILTKLGLRNRTQAAAWAIAALGERDGPAAQQT